MSAVSQLLIWLAVVRWWWWCPGRREFTFQCRLALAPQPDGRGKKKQGKWGPGSPAYGTYHLAGVFISSCPMPSSIHLGPFHPAPVCAGSFACAAARQSVGTTHTHMSIPYKEISTRVCACGCGLSQELVIHVAAASDPKEPASFPKSFGCRSRSLPTSLSDSGRFLLRLDHFYPAFPSRMPRPARQSVRACVRGPLAHLSTNPLRQACISVWTAQKGRDRTEAILRPSK